MQPNPIRVLAADDHTMWLEALTSRLENHPTIRVVGTTSDPDELLKLAIDTNPHVILADVCVHGRSIFETAGELLARMPKTKIIIVSGYLADVFVAQALRLNISGYLMKGESFDKLCAAIERSLNGERTLSASVQERVTFDPVQQEYMAKFESDLSTLTGRQLEVLRHLAYGQSVKEIAKLLHLSQKSVDSHKYRIMNKLGIHDRVELARFAIREGLMVP